MFFNLSLAQLRESPSEPADEPAQVDSVMSAIPSQEIQRMIQEVRELDEDTLKVEKKNPKTSQI